MKRSQSKADSYRNLFASCMIKNCTEPAQETHHIVPLSQGGKDIYANFICLCFDHHRHYRRHRDWEEQQEELLIHKFYSELSVIGCTSDIQENEFKHKIALWRVGNGISCPTSILPQKPVRNENKHETPHNYGCLKKPSNKKRRLCKICGNRVFFLNERYCSLECLEEGRRRLRLARQPKKTVKKMPTIPVPSNKHDGNIDDGNSIFVKLSDGLPRVVIDENKLPPGVRVVIEK